MKLSEVLGALLNMGKSPSLPTKGHPEAGEILNPIELGKIGAQLSELSVRPTLDPQSLARLETRILQAAAEFNGTQSEELFSDSELEKFVSPTVTDDQLRDLIEGNRPSRPEVPSPAAEPAETPRRHARKSRWIIAATVAVLTLSLTIAVMAGPSPSSLHSLPATCIASDPHFV